MMVVWGGGDFNRNLKRIFELGFFNRNLKRNIYRSPNLKRNSKTSNTDLEYVVG
jgi:hypothetical protein